MSLYNKYILPKVIHFVCGQNSAMRQREKLIPLAKGNILEIGVGSGLNLPLYNVQNVKHLTAIDPSIDIWNQRNEEARNVKYDLDFVTASAENLPLDSNSIDSVVFTYTLCSISNVSSALSEIRRVLKPNGQLLFCEHGKAPDKLVSILQDQINPVWKKLGGGCNLNRDIPLLIKDNGFKMKNLETMYIPGWKPASFNYWGSAKPI